MIWPKIKILLIKLISLIAIILITPFLSMINIIRGWFKGILDILIFSLLIWWIFHYSFYVSIIVVLIIKAIIILILDSKLIKQSFITTYYSFVNNLRFSSIVRKFWNQGEKSNIPIVLKVGSKQYIVAEYSNILREKDISDIKGFLIINYDTEEIVKDENIIKDILRTYLIWRYIYFENILGEDIKKESKPLIKSWIKFQDKFKEIIEKRIKDRYKSIKRLKDKEMVRILKELDNEVLKQYPYVTRKLKLELEIFNNIYNYFQYPSLELYKQFIDNVDEISKMGEEENKIWNKRLSTWSKLSSYKSIEIEKLPRPDIKRIGLGVIGDIIDCLLKQQIYPVGGATIVTTAIEGGKWARIKTRRFMNIYLTYHLFGINAIKKNIELNKKLKAVRDNYKRMWDSIPLNKVRSIN